MYFLIEDDNLLEKYITIWDKVSADIIKKFDNKSDYNKSFLKMKMKPPGNEVTDFYNKEIPKVDSNHTCLTVISNLKKDQNYYLQVSLKEYKYIEKKKVIKHINDNLSNFSSSNESSFNKLELVIFLKS